jgi:hypothetical protein
MTPEKKPVQTTSFDPSTVEQPEIDYGNALDRFINDLFSGAPILSLLELAGPNTIINSLVAAWKQTLAHELKTTTHSIVIQATASLANILEKGGLTKAELVEWRKMDLWHKPFVISRLCRADLREYFSDDQIARLTDSDLETIADKMSEAHRAAGGYWESMEITARSVLDTLPEE